MKLYRLHLVRPRFQLMGTVWRMAPIQYQSCFLLSSGEWFQMSSACIRLLVFSVRFDLNETLWVSENVYFEPLRVWNFACTVQEQEID